MMTKDIVWSLDMSDEEFVEASLPHFEKDYFDLHTGCCLVAKVDPETKSEPVGKGYLHWDNSVQGDEIHDYTRRPFKIALRAIEFKDPTVQNLYGVKPLPVVKKSSPIVTARDVLLDVRVFTMWVIEQWPHSSSGFRTAEAAYLVRKASRRDDYLSKTRTVTDHKWEQRFQAYKKLTGELGASAATMYASELGKRLNTRFKGTDLDIGDQILRKRIGRWRIGKI